MDPIDLIRRGKIERYFRARYKLNTAHFVNHITQRAAGKEPLFLEKSDYLAMISLLKEISQAYSLRTYAFCLMPNHVHLLFRPEEENLYDAMRDLFSRYAASFNRKYERKGHLFGGPYRQAVCLDDTYLLAASLYIHLNPVRAGLVRDPLAYRWSSCKLYCDGALPKSFVDPKFILGFLSEEESERIRRYRDLLRNGQKMETRHVLEQQDAVDAFRSNLASLFPSVFKRVDQGKRIAKSLGVKLLVLGELERRIEDVRKNRFPNKPETRQARRYLIEQLIARGYTRLEIAERLGISRKTVYNLLRGLP